MSLVNTLAQEFRQSAPNFDKFEFRIQEAGAYSAFKSQTENGTSFIDSSFEERAFRSVGHGLKIPVIDYKDVAIRSTRPVTIAADENTSNLYTVVFTTLAYGFKMYPALYHNNEFDYQTDFNKKFRAFLVKLTATLEGLAVTALDSAKTQVVNTVTGGHTFVSNVISETGIANLQSSYILHDIEPMMRANDFMSFDMDVIGNHGLNAILRRLEGFGQFNQENKTLPFMGMNFGFSKNVANALNKDATGFACASGSLGMVSRVERECLLGTTTKDGKEFGITTLPGLDLKVGTYFYDGVEDASAVAGAASADMTRAKFEAFDFAVDVAFITTYNSDAASIPSPIIKFDIEKA